MEKIEMRGIYASITFIIIALIAWTLLPDEKQDQKQPDIELIETEDRVEETVEEILRDSVREDPESWLNDIDFRDYAKEVLEERNIYIVTGTVYNAVVAQCNSNPLVTADGSRIDKDKLNSGDLKWIAVSRDLLKKGLSYGDRVIIRNIENLEYAGVYEIHDTMSERFTSYIDFLVPDHIKTGKWTDIIIEKIKE